MRAFSITAVLGFSVLGLPGADVETWQSVVHGDGGVPVTVAGSTLYLYGDTWTPDGRFVNSSVVADDRAMFDVLPAGPEGRWFWLGDAVELADGRLMVVVSELRRDEAGMWGFEGVDTDVFIVRDPSNVMSWRLAEHVDAGWWDGHNVRFIDGEMAAVRPYGESTTYLYDSASDSASVLFDVGSDGVFEPVWHEGAWFGVSWDMMAGLSALWSADSLGGAWTWVAGWEHEPGRTYLHGAAVIDGELVRYWSTIDGRVTYENYEI